MITLLRCADCSAHLPAESVINELDTHSHINKWFVSMLKRLNDEFLCVSAVDTEKNKIHFSKLSDVGGINPFRVLVDAPPHLGVQLSEIGDLLRSHAQLVN